MFLTKTKNLLKPPVKLEAPLLLTKEISKSFKTLLAPLALSTAPGVMEKIKAKTAKKNTLSYRLNHSLVSVALTIFLVFALTGIGFLPNYKNNGAPAFSVSLAPIVSPDDKSNSVIGAPSKPVTPPESTINNFAATKLREKSKTKVFFGKIWKFILTLWE